MIRAHKQCSSPAESAVSADANSLVTGSTNSSPMSRDAWNEWNDLRRDLYSIPRILPAHEWNQIRGQLGLAVLPAIETWLADSEAFERQARAAVPGGPAALSAPSPRLLTARPAPLPAPRSAAAHAGRSKKGSASV
ncbi:hypothetical protein AB0O75_06070 [Streptomyces sp. NPDC088921]|uniref:hypothetical protein n=1 Tax=unclassified Streptomyces TaxID=2593676 RepID=UPI0034209302